MLKALYNIPAPTAREVKKIRKLLSSFIKHSIITEYIELTSKEKEEASWIGLTRIPCL